MALVLTAVLTALVMGALAVAVLARVAAPAAGARIGEEVDRRMEARARELAALDEARAREHDARDTALHRQLGDVSGHLHRVTGLVAELQRDRAAQHGELVTRITEAHRVTETLAGTTESLQRALANPQARGQWGERMCDDVLRSAGFIEGVNYDKQRTLPDGTRPDVTFRLPDDRLLHMDVKFPLAGYLRWCEAGTDAERATALAGFLRDARSRVKELARPGYADESTVGFVLLFIPNESVYGFLHANDATLADDALAQRVVLCSPFTLFAVLGVIRQAADAMALHRGADEILDALGGFTRQWDQFTEKLESLGKQLGTVANTFDAVNGPRRRQLERQLDRVEAIRQRRGLGAPDGEEGPVLREISGW